MEGNRIVNLMVLELTADKLKLEETLEKTVNDNTIKIEEKITSIKRILKDIALNESATLIWGRQTSGLHNEELKEGENVEKN